MTIKVHHGGNLVEPTQIIVKGASGTLRAVNFVLAKTANTFLTAWQGIYSTNRGTTTAFNTSTAFTTTFNTSATTNVNTTNVTATTVGVTTVDLGDWTIVQSGSNLIFKHNGTNRFKLTSSGALTVEGDVTAFGGA